ncbi:MAG TPA: tetratricopeptide repeat-containing sensor histidine kinase [Puia sp.]|nr:tetratricopeptide repeat-containing sensor histidine kinase [Puia sp.]
MKHLYFLPFLFLCAVAPAQKQGQPLIDSLVAALPSLKEDSNKAKAYNRIAQTYEGLNPLKAFPFAQKGLELSEKLHWKRGLAIFHNNLGLYISDTGNIPLARAHFEQSLALNKEMGFKTQQANTMINIGRTYQFESDFTRATDYLYKALVIAEEMKNNDQISVIALNIGSNYFTQHNYPKTTEYTEMSLKYATLAGNRKWISKANQQLGGVRHMLKDSAGSRMYLKKAIKICEEDNNRVGLADALLNLALDYPGYKDQIAIMLRVDSIMEQINPNSEISYANKGNLGNAYGQLAKISKSPDKEIYLKKASAYLLRAKELAEQNASPEYQAHMYFMLADLEEQKSNYKVAFGYYKKANAINDSLFSQEKKNEIAGLEGKHNIVLKDNEIAISKLKLSDQRKTQIGLVVGLLLSGVIGGLLYWQSRRRKRTNTTLMVLNDRLDEANKVKARFFGILSHDLRSPIVNLIHFLHLHNEKPALLSEEQGEAQRQQISDSAESLLNTMESMLLWSKEQMENFKPNIRQVPVSELFEYLQKNFAQTGSVQISFSQPPDLMVSTDENYLKTIMQNLTSNAIRAVKGVPGGKIRWNARREGEKTIFSITDNGPGIGEQQAKALFDDSLANNEKHGFGFHLIRDLAKAIQYKISVQSQPGMGTTFTLST